MRNPITSLTTALRRDPTSSSAPQSEPGRPGRPTRVLTGLRELVPRRLRRGHAAGAPGAETTRDTCGPASLLVSADHQGINRRDKSLGQLAELAAIAVGSAQRMDAGMRDQIQRALAENDLDWLSMQATESAVLRSFGAAIRIGATARDRFNLPPALPEAAHETLAELANFSEEWPVAASLLDTWNFQQGRAFTADDALQARQGIERGLVLIEALHGTLAAAVTADAQPLSMPSGPAAPGLLAWQLESGAAFADEASHALAQVGAADARRSAEPDDGRSRSGRAEATPRSLSWSHVDAATREELAYLADHVLDGGEEPG